MVEAAFWRLCCPLPVGNSDCTVLLLSVGVSAALSVAVVFPARPLLHGPMALLANFVSVPFEVRFVRQLVVTNYM